MNAPQETSYQTVIFLHIPKTAGTTLDQIFSRQYPPGAIYTTGKLAQEGEKVFQNMEEKERARIRLLKGHMIYGLHAYIPGSSSYFTFLRDPIERTLSHYYFILRTPDHPLHEFAKSNNLDLKTCLEHGYDPLMHNGQTRLLAGVWHDVPAGWCTQEHLALAKERLAASFAVVALAERFDESLLLLKRAYGWNNVSYARRNVTANRLKQSQLPPETLTVLQEANRLDTELVAFGSDLFHQQVLKQGPAFAKELAEFQRYNRRMSPLLELNWRFRQFSLRQALRKKFG